MTEAAGHEPLIETLAASLQPSGRLPRPALRAAAWIGLAVAIGLVLAPFADLGEIGRRLVAEPDMWLACLGSILTAACAAWAAFATAVPGTDRRWALLPLPALALWIGASGWGCMRTDLVPDTSVAQLAESRSCLVFILALSVPLSAAMLMMMRSAFALRPGVTAALAGLAAAAAAATLLNLVHPYDAAVTDLAVHAVAVAAVVAAARAFGVALHGGRPLPMRPSR